MRAVVLSAQVDESNTAATLLTDARSASEDIRRLAPRPATALDPRITDAQILRDVQDALQQAGVPAAAIRELSIDARADERAAASADVIRRSGRLALDSTSLPLIGATLNALRARLPALRIDNISMQRASAPDTLPATFRVTIGFVGYVSAAYATRIEPTTAATVMPTPPPTPQPQSR
ncbi:MAG: hypothetical protein K2X32_14295 [Phycisphaerales bacterium]|nr:hypothetical protein [Phycisphaerales bacterium]MBX9926415.1 hypothetical protein [Hyphomicrobiaceae bacterium]